MVDIPASRRRLEGALLQLTRRVREAFLNAVRAIRDDARVSAIESAIERGDIERAIDLVGADERAFRPVQRAIQEAFEGGGELHMRDMPRLRGQDGVRILTRFDPGNPRGERIARELGARFVTRVVPDQRDALRHVIGDGLAVGRNPRRVARDVTGRISRATGRREGGIIGLTRQQAGFVTGARAELASGDPARMSAYLDRTARDRRFDRSVRAAIDAGRAPSADVIQRATGRYSDGLLDVRGNAIARTEGAGAANAGRDEAMEQAIEDAGLDRGLVTKVWQTVGGREGDERTREAHKLMHGEEVGIDERFSNGLRHPLDPEGLPEEIIQCRCVVVYRIAQAEQSEAA